MIRSLLVCLIQLVVSQAQAQKILGLVVEESAAGETQPLPGATVHWLGTTTGTTTKDKCFTEDSVIG